MEPRKGWLERSFERVEKKVEARPERLKPAAYRTKKSADTATRRKASRTS
jgi:hypothetical protein